jgi:hypothetical protein
MDHPTSERIAQNDAAFREANEQIRTRAQEWGIKDNVPFLCECSDLTCTRIVRLPPAEYERIRTDPSWFLTAPGHTAAPGVDAEVVERHPGYEIVGKVAPAGEW